MNDERLERQVKAALERDARPLPSGLRARVSAVPDEFPRERRSPRFTQLVAAAGAIAAVLVLAAAALVLMGLHDATIGPASTATPSPQGTGPAVVAPASPSASSAIAPSVLAPVSGAWSGLLWSAPTDFPGPMGADGVVAFGGQLYAIGQLQVGSEHETAVWRSADGLYWTTLVQGGRAFAGAGSLTLLATPSELLAWGQGVPACSGPVTSQTCRPAPQIIMTSQDGVTWTRAPDVSALSGATIQGLAAGASGLVAVGETASGAAVIWTSADGSAWVREPLGPTFADAHFFSVRAAGPGFLISGGTGSQEVSVTGGPAGVVPVDAAIWWSTDGRAWTKATLQPSSAGGAYVSEIFVGADGLVAVGAATGARGEGAAWTSSDGRTWAPIAMRGSGLPSPVPGQAVLPSSYIVDDGTHMVAIGTTTGQVATWWSSTDGTTWTPLVASGSTATTPVQQGDSAYVDRWFNRAFVVPGGLVVVGPGTGSPDAPGPGRVWLASAVPGTLVTPSSTPPTPAPSATPPASETVGGYLWHRIDSQFGGAQPGPMTALGSEVVLATDPLRGVWAPGQPMLHPTFWHSADGSIWQRLPDSPAFAGVQDKWVDWVLGLSANGPGLIAVGMQQSVDGSAANAEVWTSPDGKTWTRASVDGGNGAAMSLVYRVAGGFVAIGTSRYAFNAGTGGGIAIWTSPDGTHWTRLPQSESPTGLDIISVAHGNGRYVAVGQAVKPGSSTAGVHLPIWTSSDGVHYQVIAPALGVPTSDATVAQVTWTGSAFVAVGDEPTVGSYAWRSTDGLHWQAVELQPFGPATPGTTAGGIAQTLTGLLAVGAVGGVGGSMNGALWESSDGRTWQEVTMPALFDNVDLGSVRVLGSHLLVGGVDRASGASVVWMLDPGTAGP